MGGIMGSFCSKDTTCSSMSEEQRNLVATVTKKLNDLYNETPCMPIMVRLAWHDAGTYCASTQTGGPTASIRFTPEKSHGANNGLQWAMDKLEPLKAAHPEISYADLYQLASVVAVQFCGGPEIPFRLGRKDAPGEEQCTDDGRLPDATKGHDHLRDIFYRMGFTDKEIVALSGAHTLGRAHSDRSGFEGAWTKEPLIFDNSYFQELLKKDEDPSLLKLPSDTALLNEPSMRKWVEAYAEDESKFFEDYSKAHQKLSELGVTFA
mmetsp:Transcript_18563/g.24520  ORF Transcript_18563/g.24520 Transcript_18563/m.24520 type:complete len:264 (-) Transcript_18563:171-962(-)|eukprot:CAMPEP_0117795664 /NCGR_PEP_ID=MMETSP0948-20121206/11453_1 /TAXON_ID=44440 /ORGANISM="Chattonella subsalsa, Strain CCMP2191" /LENGTH=263 /DNA_ID=CAMNT_0005626683 /DNA_START=54 /DNA_END=845 /DNA_ORIENTATION=+